MKYFCCAVEFLLSLALLIGSYFFWSYVGTFGGVWYAGALELTAITIGLLGLGGMFAAFFILIEP